MSQERLQAHFDKEPISYLGRGNQVRVHGTTRLALKVDDPLTTVPAIIGDIYRQTLPQAKAGMGGLVLPFEMPAHIEAHELHTRPHWVFFEKEERVPVHFANPVVQERVDDHNRLRICMERVSRTSEANHFGDLLLAWVRLTVNRGFFPYEINPSNFVVCHGNLLLRDLGAIIGKGNGRRNVLRNKPEMERLAGMYADAYAPLLGDSDIASAFRRRLTRLLVDAHREIRQEPSEAYPVPDLSF